MPLTVTNKGFGSVSQIETETNSERNSGSAPSARSSSASSAQNDINGNNGNNVTHQNSKKKKNVEPKQPPSLRTKLDIVANDENLTSAIVALTEWIVKAATPFEVSAICFITYYEHEVE